MKPHLLIAALLTLSLHAAEPLFTSEGTDPTFAELLKSGAIKPGDRFSKGPVLGSKIKVNHPLLKKQTGKTGAIPKGIGLHTQASGGIKRKDFGNWTRWYQEDGNTQIFRLFPGEQNIRSGAGKDGSAGRVEAYSNAITVVGGAWHEWEGVFTIIKPHQANIFQLFHEGHLWAFHIRMTDDGNIYFASRIITKGIPERITLADHMTGKSLALKVRGNGDQYEVFKKDPAAGKDWELVTKGNYTKAAENKISFRWGMYSGSAKGSSIKHDAMLFVTGATYR